MLTYSSTFMAVLVKWLTRWIVAPVCVGSIPTYRPICENRRTMRLEIKLNLKRIEFFLKFLFFEQNYL